MIQSCFQLLALGAQNVCQIPAPHMWSVVCAQGNSEGWIFFDHFMEQLDVSDFILEINCSCNLFRFWKWSSAGGTKENECRQEVTTDYKTLRTYLHRKWQPVLWQLLRKSTEENQEGQVTTSSLVCITSLVWCTHFKLCLAILHFVNVIICFFLTATFSSCFTISQNANSQRLMPD